MKKFMSFILAALCVMTLALNLTGCASSGKSESSSGRPAVAFVLGNTANAKGLNLGSKLIEDTISEAVYNYGYIAVVNCDGDCDIPISANLDLDESKKAATTTMLKNRAASETVNIVTAMSSVIANDPEVDYLQGIQLATRALNSLDGYDSKTIVVVGTGLSSTGVCNFRNNLLFADTEAVISKLAEKENIPDMSGITVVWQQMADVAAPQQELTQLQRKKLQEIWGGIIEAGGGTFVYNEVFPVTYERTSQYPDVSVVELPTETPLTFDPVMLTEEPEENPSVFSTPVFLAEKQVQFIGDSDEYLDPDEAVAVMSPIADYLLANPDVELLLIGTTAGDGNSDYTMSLSARRAEMVKATLMALGVDSSRLTAIGLGSSDPWHIYGVGTEGALASENRKVVLLDSRTELAQSLLIG